MAEGRRHRPGEDHISGLPDDLLHVILVRLGSARAAARTGVLSGRWRHVWKQLPQLVLSDRDWPPPASFLDSVDAALAAHSAPTVKLLFIALPFRRPFVSACRVAPWLHFASQRVVDTIQVYVPLGMRWLPTPEVEEELEIPVCDRAKRINLKLEKRWRLRLPPAGLFPALIHLTIRRARVEGNELAALVSTQCPSLKILSLDVTLCTVSDVSMRMDHVESLWLGIGNTSRVEVVAPMLEQLTVRDVESHVISAPKLAVLYFQGNLCDPRRHQFVDVRRHLRILRINLIAAPLLQRFDSVDALELDISISPELEYENFLNETKKFPKCETMSVSVWRNQHGLVPIMHHLLKSCSTTRKISVTLEIFFYSWVSFCPLSCVCRLEQNRKIDDISLGSLEEVEVSNFTGSHEEVEFVEHLSRCNPSGLKKIVIYYKRSHTTTLTEVCQKVRSNCHQNLKVKFYVDSGRRSVPLD